MTKENKTNVVDLHKDKIVLTNGDVTLFVLPMRTPQGQIIYVPNSMTIQGQALEKINNASVISGKTLYWIKRVIDKMSNVFVTVEKTRMDIIKTYTEKDEDDNFVFIDAKPTIDDSKKKPYAEKLVELKLDPNGDIPEDVKSEFYKRDDNGKIIMSGGTQYKIVPERFPEFAKTVNDLMDIENVFSFDKIAIDTETLEKMNKHIITFSLISAGKPPNTIGIGDMTILEKIFAFIE